jgi:hypothetical protein
MAASVHILGIRHHGPGSASSVKAALKALQPDVICLEFPFDGAALIPKLQSKDLQPPVAAIIYEEKQKERLALLPFASFSPEWIALQYARTCDIPIIPIDLSFSIQRAIELQHNERAAHSEDVLRMLANLAGFDRVESWWDEYLEREGQPLEIFEQLQHIMKLVREDQPVRKVNQLREAFMRTAIRKQLKKFQNIAVVCGAYHGPALTHLQDSMSSDRELLKSWKGKKVRTSLIPFSYKRLTQQSGYASGIQSPKYYEYVFRYKERAHEQWLGLAGRALRQKGFLTSVDDQIAAIQLAEQLAYIREMNQPGLSELIESAEATLCKGETERLQWIQQEAMIGSDIGFIPPKEQEAPLIEDFMSQIRKFRLQSFWRPEKAPPKPFKEFDLRKPTHLLSSRLLHRSLILQMNWAQEQKPAKRKLGTFHESWRFDWDIEDEIQLHHAASLGLTVEEAAENMLAEQLQLADSLPQLLHLLNHALKGDLHPISQQLLNQLEVLSTDSEDIHELLFTNNSLIEIMRYGSVRQLDSDQLMNICHHMHERICTQLPYACQPMEEEWSRSVFQQLQQYFQTLLQVHETVWLENWAFSLALLQKQKEVDPRISGFVYRMRYDLKDLSKSHLSTALDQHLDSSYDPAEQAKWLEGFLFGSGRLLVYHDVLFDRIHHWVKSIDEEVFKIVLPILNRTFAQYSSKDRQELLQKIKGNTGRSSSNEREKKMKEWVKEHLMEAAQKLQIKIPS